jgi:hypothetical protein
VSIVSVLMESQSKSTKSNVVVPVTGRLRERCFW